MIGMVMPPRAIEALNAQLSLIRYFKTEVGAMALGGFIDSTRKKETQANMFGLFDDGRSVAEREHRRLDRATTFYVENDMISLVSHASYSMPRQVFQYTDLPCDYGFVLFQTPILTKDVRGRTISVAAVSWGPAVGIDKMKNQIPGVSLMFYSDIEDPRDSDHEYLSESHKILAEKCNAIIPKHSLFHVTNMAYGTDIAEVTEHELMTLRNEDGTESTVPYSQVNNAETGTVDPHRFFYAFLVLSQQRVASIARVVDRHAVRRMKREMSTPPEDGVIQVVGLRRYSKPRDDDEDEGNSINWTHRWIVHGFWRNQWYPSLGTHRLIWINDFVKGPENLPLIVKDTIYDLRR